MIVRQLDSDNLLCINQTSHALMAADFCRHWGNSEIAKPEPYSPVLLGIAQHDNGWYEWECHPGLRPDGYPMDFMHGPMAEVKLKLWRNGVARAAAQHPYAGLLVGQHAALLYEPFLDQMEGEERQATLAFIAEQAAHVETTRTIFTGADWQRILRNETILAHTRLLQFGDSASLKACMPWREQHVFKTCPVDFCGSYMSIVMRTEATAIPDGEEGQLTFAPWPFNVNEFTVTVHGRRLTQRTFDNDQAYHTALKNAPIQELRWRVQPG